MLERFIEIIKRSLKEGRQYKNKNWEIVWVDVDSIFCDYGIYNQKAIIFAKRLKLGAIFPPITLAENGQVADGQTRVEAYRLAKRKRIPALIPVEEGSGELLKDEVYAPQLKTFKEDNLYLDRHNVRNLRCMGCLKRMFRDGNPEDLFRCAACEVWTEIAARVGRAIIPTIIPTC